MTPKEKANHLSILFGKSTDVVKPNMESVEMAFRCVSVILNDARYLEEDNLIDKQLCYWQDVEAELTLLYNKIIGLETKMAN